MSSVRIAEAPVLSAEDVMKALDRYVARALEDVRADKRGPLDYFADNKALRAIVRNMGWKPEGDFGHGDEYVLTITHQGAATAILTIDLNGESA